MMLCILVLTVHINHSDMLRYRTVEEKGTLKLYDLLSFTEILYSRFEWKDFWFYNFDYHYVSCTNVPIIVLFCLYLKKKFDSEFLKGNICLRREDTMFFFKWKLHDKKYSRTIKFHFSYICICFEKNSLNLNTFENSCLFRKKPPPKECILGAKLN